MTTAVVYGALEIHRSFVDAARERLRLDETDQIPPFVDLAP